EPGSHIALPADASRLQVVDGKTGGHRRQPGLGRLDRLPGTGLAVEAEEGLLDEILRLAGTAHHPIGDREHQRPEVLVDRGFWGVSFVVHGPSWMAFPSRTGRASHL